MVKEREKNSCWKCARQRAFGIFSLVYTRRRSSIVKETHLLARYDSVATSDSRQRETRPGTDQERARGNIAVDCVRALVLPLLLLHTSPRGMSKRLASIVRRSPCYPFHGSPRDSFVRGNPLLTKFNIHPAAQYARWNSRRARNPRICVRLIGGIPDIAEKILSQLRRAACSRCSSMNLPTETSH